jgi:hypothetical protein
MKPTIGLLTLLFVMTVFTTIGLQANKEKIVLINSSPEDGDSGVDIDHHNTYGVILNFQDSLTPDGSVQLWRIDGQEAQNMGWTEKRSKDGRTVTLIPTNDSLLVEEEDYEVIHEALAKGDSVSLIGFGTFEVRRR